MPMSLPRLRSARRLRSFSLRLTIPVPQLRSKSARFFAPDLTLLHFPAWDCLPYDRVSPRSDIESRRLATLAALAAREDRTGAALVITTVNALLQRVPPRQVIVEVEFSGADGQGGGPRSTDEVSRPQRLFEYRDGARTR